MDGCANQKTYLSFANVNLCDPDRLANVSVNVEIWHTAFAANTIFHNINLFASESTVNLQDGHGTESAEMRYDIDADSL
ncbi:hypothetical protein JCM24511_06558 [Saitozyma sp. JCM 24511]|nr:hypothetical protein JCM24511_06558 [Saitozyma sp. JCM 24511]